MHAGGTLPRHGARFAVAPLGVAMIGVWIASCDASGSPYPLVFVRRITPEIRALPWPLRFAACASFLDTVELGLMLARREALPQAYSRLEALAWPAARELDVLQLEAREGLAQESVAMFARRNFPAANAPCAALEHALRQLRPRRRRGSCLELSAGTEFDLVAWLELIRAQRPPSATPHAIFWAPAAAHAIVCFDDPHPRILHQLARCAGPLPHSGPAHERLCSDVSIAELSRMIALGKASLPIEAFVSMPPPLSSRP